MNGRRGFRKVGVDMFGLYTKKDMRRLAARLKEEYTAALKTQRDAVRELKEQNRTLSARVAELENERQEVAGEIGRASCRERVFSWV